MSSKRLFIPCLLVLIAMLVTACEQPGELRIRNRTSGNVQLNVNGEQFSLNPWGTWARTDYSLEQTIPVTYSGDYVFENHITRDVGPNQIATLDIHPAGGAIKIVNDRETALINLYLSPSGDPQWGADSLDVTVLPDENCQFVLTPGTWDIKTEDINYTPHYLYNQTVVLDQTLTLLLSSFSKGRSEKKPF
jgi:hypothetical protein